METENLSLPKTKISEPKHKGKDNENPWLNLLLNIVIPAVIMMKFSGDQYLGPVKGLIIALAFPVAYGIYDFLIRRKFNFFSALGFVSILLTGGIGLLKLDKDWIAVKEAAVPLIIGIVVLASTKTRFPIAKKLLFNEKMIETEKVQAALEAKGNAHAFDKLFQQITLILFASFMVSAVLNYVLAKVILVSESGTVAFNEEMGKMTALSFPVIVVPSTIIMMLALWRLVHGIKKLTGFELKDIVKGLKEIEEKHSK